VGSVELCFGEMDGLVTTMMTEEDEQRRLLKIFLFLEATFEKK